MTNNEHNEKILIEIVAMQERIKDLQSQLLPAEPLPEVDLVACNRGALAAREAEFEQANRLKTLLENAVNGGTEQTKEPARRRRREAAAED